MASSPSSSPSPQAGQPPPSSADAESDKTPAVAVILGVLGLLPFAGAAALYAFGADNERGVALLTLLAYSAAILSFLGGTRWGMEIAARRPPRASVLVLSNLPPIAAWLLLAGGGGASLTEVQSLGGFLLAFAVQGAWDARASGAPGWHRRLRLALTAGAVLSLALALATTLSV